MAYFKDELFIKPSFAREKRWVEDKFIEQFGASLMQLGKLYLWQDDINNRNHWKQNVYGCCEQIFRWGSGKGDLLSSDDLYTLYLDTYGRVPEITLQKAMNAENNHIELTAKQIEEFETIQNQYAEWACNEYSQKQVLDNILVYGKIDELIPV